MNSRFAELTRKYRENAMDQEEFREFTAMLNDSGNLRLLDDALTEYWHDMPAQPNETELPVNGNRLQGRKGGRRLFLKIAASFLVLAAVPVFYFAAHRMNQPYTSYKTGFSETLEVALPDGSEVTLNANTELKWDNRWKDDSVRLIILEGEAFFDVQQLESEMPFIVETGALSVEVTGTSFNVNNRDEQVEVYLDEGKVNLHIEDDSIVMHPGEKVRYNTRQKKVEKTANESMTSAASWRKGVLSFRDMPFRDVLSELKNIYGKSFECQDEALLSKAIYLGVPYSNWETVKQALELSLDIRIREKGNIIEITAN